MKKSYKYVSAILLIALSFSLFSACGKNKNKEDAAKSNLITEAINISLNNKTLSTKSLEASMGAFAGKADTTYEVLFGEPHEINTVILKEESENNILGFRIEVEKDNEYVTVYEQDIVGQLRYCTFNNVKTNGFRIVVTDVVNNGKFKIVSTEAFYIKTEKRDFRVTSYLYASDAYKKEHFNSGALNVVTDIVIYGLTSFNNNGDIIYNDITVDNKKISGKNTLINVIKNINDSKAKIKKDIKIHINLIYFDDKQNEQASVNESLNTGDVTDNADNLIASIKALLSEFKLDGMYIDFSFLETAKAKKAYSTLIADIKENIPDKILGASLSIQCLDLSKKAINALDRVEIAAYNTSNSFGNHSPFDSVFHINAFLDAGYKKEQLSLGIPFFGKPSDMGDFLYSYSLEAEKLGKYRNIAKGAAFTTDDKCDTRYYNSYQMVFDKTAYAYDSGIAGVMVWHMNCDLPFNNKLSLFKSIKESLAAR